MPVPRVVVRNSVRKPMRPRDGTMNSMRTQPVPWFAMFSMRPLRAARSCVIAPRYSSGASIVRCSNGSCSLAVDLLGDHLRLADGELEALAAHLLDEDGERELATTLHLPRVGAADVDDLERDVTDELAVEAVLDHAGGELVALDLADERRGVGADRHRDGGVVDRDGRQRAHVVGVGEGLTDGDVLEAGDGDDVAGAGATRPGSGRAPW